ncbi:glycoside hydrolase family 3 C-terminal domain-containing protein, partial [uncultured Catenibacterium sp.]|uniref:glycoside hydrolase family 3 C-terminal domain-containing protein n=1 Tax=uncultured Catenibacterium sp. TaxID=286142 RepID=UPI0025CBA541
NDHVQGVAAGSNLEMPSCGYDSAREVIDAVRDGQLKEEDLDERVGELVDAVMELTSRKTLLDKNFDKDAHHQLARKAAAESMILLKNEKQILPLDTKKSIAIIGDFAFTPRYQGAGSSMVNPTKVEDMSSILHQYDLNIIGMTRGYQRNGNVDENERKSALNLSMNADIVIFCFGLDEISESEGLDRTHMRLPQGQIDLLKDISKVNENVIGILSAGSAVEMSWHNYCKAILHGYLNGQAGALATIDILAGKVNPSGKLAETYPISYEETPAFRYYPSSEKTSEYRESVYVGYRYYDTSKIQVQYPFGFGLSYTEFKYSDLLIEEDGIKVSVTNTGERDGAEVVQMYVSLPHAIVFRPEKELKGFEKVYLKAGESKQIRIPFDDKTFRYWNIKTRQWEIETGTYQIMVGASVTDIRLTGMTEKIGNSKEYPYNPAKLFNYYTGMVQNISDEEFRELLGHEIPSGRWSGNLGINDAICQMYYAKSRLARLIYRCLTKMKKKSEAQGKPDLNILFIYNMPFRAIAKMTGGAVSMEMVYGIVDAVNGHFMLGVKKIINGYFKNRRNNKEFEKLLKGAKGKNK